MARTPWELLVRRLTPFHIYLCRDCEHRGWYLGTLPDAGQPTDQRALGLPSRPVERRDSDVRRRRWRRAVISFVIAIALGAWFGRCVHNSQQPSVEQGE